MKEEGLPPGWCWVELGALTTQFMNGFGKRRQEAGSPVVVLRLADISDGAVTLDAPRRVNATADERCGSSPATNPSCSVTTLSACGWLSGPCPATSGISPI